MHVAINATCRRGLRIIDEVPDINLCKIEGYNGIGKTSAIRLLQICTGQQPFNRNSLAWRTFRDQLVRANVKITGLTQADDIEWQIEPARDWPKLPEVLDETIGSIRVNSKQATMADVRSLLEVQHLYTTETPEKILSAQAEFAASTIDRWFYEDGQSRAQQLDRLIARAARLVSEVPTNQIRLARDVAEESKTAALHVANRTSVLRTRVERLDRAVQIADQLDTVRGTSPLLVAQLQEAMDQLAALDDHRNRLTEAISQAQLRRHLDEQAQETLAKAEKLLERRNRSLQRLRQELNHAALKANVSPVGELVAHAIVTMRSELDSLVEAQPLASVAPSLLAILSGILRYLDEAMLLVACGRRYKLRLSA